MMQTPPLSIAISLAALAMASLSLLLQFHWNGHDPQLDANDHSAGRQETTPTIDPAINAASSIDQGPKASTPGNTSQLEEKIARLERELDGLQRLIRASGLELVVPLWGMHPGGPGPVLEQIGKEAADRAQFQTRMEELNRQAADIRDSDYVRYGAERYRQLEELYRTAKPGRGFQSEEYRAKRTTALNRMLDEFPDAYETGVAVAEQALQEALDGNAAEVEAYLQTLLATSPHTNIITEQGLEAVPTIQTFLARQYIEQNRVEDAAALLDQIARNYPNSLIVEPSPGNAPSAPRTALAVASELRQQIGGYSE